MSYDSELRNKLTAKTDELWRKAMLGEEYNFSFRLKPPVELAKSAGRIHEVDDWSRFWKQQKQPWHLITANKRPKKTIGSQKDFPVKVEFRTVEAALRYLHEWGRFQRLQNLCEKIVTDFPQLRSLCADYREDILSIADRADCIWQLAHYFSGNYRTHCYLRELDIPYVDTKFIEKNTKLTVDIFFALHKDMTVHSFGNLCAVLHWQVHAPTPNIYLRSLDPKKSIGGLQELMVTADQLAKLSIPFDRIFFTENKLNGFGFPEVENGLIIFGAGNGVLKREDTIPWLENHDQLWYWGDIDRDGLRILSRMRAKYPQIRSFLMTRELAVKYAHFMTADKGKTGEMPANLTGQEQDCWLYLTGQPAEANRLEQEKIPISEVRMFLQLVKAY